MNTRALPLIPKLSALPNCGSFPAFSYRRFLRNFSTSVSFLCRLFRVIHFNHFSCCRLMIGVSLSQQRLSHTRAPARTLNDGCMRRCVCACVFTLNCSSVSFFFCCTPATSLFARVFDFYLLLRLANTLARCEHYSEYVGIFTKMHT